MGRRTRKEKRPEDFFICPVCGAEVSSRAPACPECGSDDTTGWSEDTIYDGLDLWDEEEETAGETPPASPPGPTLFRSRLLFLAAAILAGILFLLFFLR